MPSKTILIVEDDSAIRDVLKAVINDETAHQVFAAPDAETALDMLHQIIPGLFLVDYMLPGMNGIEFIERIRQNGHKHTPIVIITACLLWQGVTDVQVLHKPFELDTFLQIVEACLKD